MKLFCFSCSGMAFKSNLCLLLYLLWVSAALSSVSETFSRKLKNEGHESEGPYLVPGEQDNFPRHTAAESSCSISSIIFL